MTPTPAILREDQRLRLTIVGFAGVMLVLILLSIQLSMLQVPSASLVYGSTQVWRGQSAGFRVMTVHPERIRPILAESVQATLKDGKGVRWEKTKSRRLQSAFLIPIPDDLQNDATLELEVVIEGEREQFQVQLHPVDQPEMVAGTIHHNHGNLGKLEYQPPGTPEVELYPSTHHITSALPNRVTGRITQAGKPLSAALAIRNPELKTQSGPDGLFSFDYTPPPNKKPLEIYVGSAPAIRTKVPVNPHPIQLLLDIEHGPMTEAFESLDYTLYSLPYRKPIHVDTWVGKSLVHISSTIAIDGMHRGEIELTEAPLPTTVVAFRNVIVPEANASWRTFWPGELSNESHRLTLASWLKSQKGGDTLHDLSHEQIAATPKLLEMLMSRFKPESIGPQLIHSNREARQEAFDVYRVELRSHINIIFGATAGLGMLLAIIWIVRHRRRVRLALQQVADEAIAEGEDYDPEGLSEINNNNLKADLLMIVFWLLLFVYSIYVLLARYMKWDLL